MAVFIGKLNAVNFLFENSEFSAGKVPGIGIVGAICLEIDTGYYWVVGDDLVLVRYYLPSGVIAASEVHIGEIGASTVVVPLSLSLAAAAYHSNDVLSATQELADAVRVDGGSGILQSIQVIDQDDQGQPIDIFIFSGSAALGTENAAISISDADAAQILGIVRVVANDYIDCINSMNASINGLNIPVEVASGTSLYVATATRGTPTHTGSGIVLNIGILQD